MSLLYTLGNFFLPSLIWKRNTPEKVVYLTFDDGPHPTITPWVIDTLEKYNARGTFFVVGENVVRHKDVMMSAISRGHAIGNHTQKHIKGWRSSVAKYLGDIEMCAAHLPEKRLFRPPYGQINFQAIDEINRDYEIIMWDVLTKDYLPRLNVRKALDKIKRQTQNGSIIVFHDSEKSERNLKALLPKYLQYLSDNKYRMEVL